MSSFRCCWIILRSSLSCSSSSAFASRCYIEELTKPSSSLIGATSSWRCILSGESGIVYVYGIAIPSSSYSFISRASLKFIGFRIGTSSWSSMGVGASFYPLLASGFSWRASAALLSNSFTKSDRAFANMSCFFWLVNFRFSDYSSFDLSIWSKSAFIRWVCEPSSPSTSSIDIGIIDMLGL